MQDFARSIKEKNIQTLKRITVNILRESKIKLFFLNNILYNKVNKYILIIEENAFSYLKIQGKRH